MNRIYASTGQKRLGRVLFAFSSALLCLPLASRAVDIPYSGAATDDDAWSNPINWQGNVIPADDSTGAAFWNDGTRVVIAEGDDISCKGFMLGMYGSTNSAEMTGGSVTCDWLDVGRSNLNGGDGTLTLSGGSIDAKAYVNIPTQFATQTDPANIGRGRINLLGGTLSAADLHIGSGQTGLNGGHGTLYLTDGSLLLNGDKTARVQSYIDLGYITTDDFRGFLLDYNQTAPGKTTLRTEATLAIYTGLGSNDHWETAANWLDNIIPTDLTLGAGFSNANTHVRIGSSTDALCLRVLLGMHGSTNTAEIDGGTLSCQALHVGHGNQDGGDGILTIRSGQVQVAGAIKVPHQFSSLTDPSRITRGRMNVYGGIISGQSLHIGDGKIGQDGGFGSIHLTEGSLVLSGNIVPQIQSYIDLGYITTDAYRRFLLDYDQTTSGKTTLRSEVFFDGVAHSPNPMSGSRRCPGKVDALRWGRVQGADAYEVYFGTDRTPPRVATLSGHEHRYALPALAAGRTYYWRIDVSWSGYTNTGPLWSFTTNGELDCAAVQPPFTNYCEMLSQEIQGKKHGFLAGNNTYYIGGFHPSWNLNENETIGLTHPFHNDLRSRGYGMVEDEDTGYGHDLSGWEFYKHTKVAYGTVIIDGVRHEHPVPTAMHWRPDRMICEYQVGEVRIREEKFIALNDAVCTRITSDQPVTIEFAGQSFYADGITQSTTATCAFDSENNRIHIVSGGINLVKPTQDNQVPGVMMYEGMSTILTASRPITNYSNSTESTGQQKYSFTLPADASGLSLVWAMHDDAATAAREAQAVLADPQSQIQSKTDYMNGLLNNQIPYFRCSEQGIVDVYYFLWAIYLMYDIDLSDENPDFYRHTQTAVNNFLGLHRYDAAIQIPVGSWTVDKDAYANGNVLRWKPLLPHANLENGRIPADNVGKKWHSGLWGGITPHVPGAWKIYQHSGDRTFLTEAYTFYRALMWNAIPGFWGHQYRAADCLGLMALELGYPQSEVDHWQQIVKRDNFDRWLNTMWEKDGIEHFFGGTAGRPLHWTTFAYLAMDGFPQEWARDMVETWALDSVVGFNARGQVSTVAAKDWHGIPNKNFFITPDTNYFALNGMYTSGVYDHANSLLLAHLKSYNMRWGIPCAPEAVDENHEFHGDQYSNFNAGKILLILEGILGLSYSVVEDSFTVADNLPLEWDYMESYVPVHHGGTTSWVHVLVEREKRGSHATKRIRIENNPLQHLRVQPWLENQAILQAPANYMADPAPGHIRFEYEGKASLELELNLSDAPQNEVLRESFRIIKSPEARSNEIAIQFGLKAPPVAGTELTLERSSTLTADSFEGIFRLQSNGRDEILGADIRSRTTHHYYTIFDRIFPNGHAFYRLRTTTSD